MKVETNDVACVAAVQHILALKLPFEATIIDQSWNPFSCETIVYSGKPLITGNATLPTYVAMAWLADTVPVVVTEPQPKSDELARSGLLAGYTVMTNDTGRAYLFQKVLVQPNVPTVRSVAVTGGKLVCLNRDQVTAWDGEGRKEAPTLRQSTQMAAVRPPSG